MEEIEPGQWGVSCPEAELVAALTEEGMGEEASAQRRLWRAAF